MQYKTGIALWCKRIIEGGWLLAILLVPTYFNILSARHFEPDKAIVLCSIVLIMVAAAAIHGLEIHWGRMETIVTNSNVVPEFTWRHCLKFPMVLPVLFYSVVFVFATIASIVPYISFWGSYYRLQGTYTNLSYVGLGVLIVLYLRRREQVERLITVVMITALICSGYGLLQHFELDPFLWNNDVVNRVAGTMGNSIFIAAYLIMIVPLILYHVIISFFNVCTEKAPLSIGWSNIAWFIVYLLITMAALGIVLSALLFSSMVQVDDLHYWWVYPAALIIAGGLMMIPTLRVHASKKVSALVLMPAVLALVYSIVLNLIINTGQSAEHIVYPRRECFGLEWSVWLLGGLLLMSLGYILLFMLKHHTVMDSRLFSILQGMAAILITLLTLAVIVFTQSRGPWIGGMTALFIFFTILLALVWHRAKTFGSTYTTLWRNLLIGEIIAILLLVTFIIVFNLSAVPVFNKLREAPYIGRLGTLLEVNSGTGLIRRLIWAGDNKAGGAIALITSDPVRMFIGWGPDSMSVAYSPFYPPRLAHLGARDALLDRSHQAYLDELINKGILGLLSYLWVLGAFAVLVWRLLRFTDDFPMQVLIIACAAAVVAHIMEGLTGIPTVSSLMMQAVAIAIVVASGRMLGRYGVKPFSTQATSVVAIMLPRVPAGRRSKSGDRRRRLGVLPASGSSPVVHPVSYGSRGVAILVYSFIMGTALLGVWKFNLDNSYADMYFRLAQHYVDAPGDKLENQIVGSSFYITAIRHEPRQDLYYLNLGRSLMAIAVIQYQKKNRQIDEPRPENEVENLLQLTDEGAAKEFLLHQSPASLMKYAEAVLLRAHELNPLNKEYLVNLGRMYNLWYNHLTKELRHLALSEDWFRRAHTVAPQDVMILSEYVSTILQRLIVAQSQNDTGKAAAAIQEATVLLAKAQQLDPDYLETQIRLADLYRLQGDISRALDLYMEILEKNPHALDGRIVVIIEALHDKPEAMARLRSAYETVLARKIDDPMLLSIVGLIATRTGDLQRAVEAFGKQTELEPTDIKARQAYTLVLLNLKRYDEAVISAQKLVEITQQYSATDQQKNNAHQLLQLAKMRSGRN